VAINISLMNEDRANDVYISGDNGV